MTRPIIFWIFALGSLALLAQTSRKYSNEFLNIGVDASALGMASAAVGSPGDVNSGYWNPAGLLALEDQQMGLMHASYFANFPIALNYFNSSQKSVSTDPRHYAFQYQCTLGIK